MRAYFIGTKYHIERPKCVNCGFHDAMVGRLACGVCLNEYGRLKVKESIWASKVFWASAFILAAILILTIPLLRK